MTDRKRWFAKGGWHQLDGVYPVYRVVLFAQKGGWHRLGSTHQTGGNRNRWVAPIGLYRFGMRNWMLLSLRKE
jgi:hypothetical protein